jgi:hypothetical protein
MPPRPPPTPLLASTPCAIERLPRITRAESIDVPCCQAAHAGYRAMVEATASCDRAFRLLMSAADTVSTANVFGLRSRVARLRAIATAPAFGSRGSAPVCSATPSVCDPGGQADRTLRRRVAAGAHS